MAKELETVLSRLHNFFFGMKLAFVFDGDNMVPFRRKHLGNGSEDCSVRDSATSYLAAARIQNAL